MMTTRGGLTAALAAAMLGAAACARPADPAGADDALRYDLDAAQAHAATSAQPARTQFVSPLELGRAASPAGPTAARRVAARTAALARTPSHAARATPVARVVRPEPADAATEAADVPAADAPREHAEAPHAPVSVDPAPPPVRDEPVVAAPSRRTDPPLPPRRRGAVWNTGDVIRNAPFPINP